MFAYIFITAVMAVVTLLSGCFGGSNAGLSEQPELARAYQRSETNSMLRKYGVRDVRLTCSWPGMKISGKFEFEVYDGREPVEVTGTTSCTKSGTLVHIEYWRIRAAQENYDSHLVDREVSALLAAGKIEPAVHNSDNKAAGLALTQKFLEPILASSFTNVTFSCDRAGAAYKYFELGEFGLSRSKTGYLTTRCEKAHQNFIVMSSLEARYRSNGSLGPAVVFVEDYNAVPVARIEAAFGEYIAAKPVISKF